MAKPITHRRVLHIALPVVLSNATVPMLGVIDTGVVGQLGAAAPIGAVGIGALILTTLYWVFGFLRMGTSGFAAQALGRGDDDEAAAILSRALGIGAVAGIAIIALQLPLFAVSLRLSPASAEVEAMARTYMGIRVWSAPALIALYSVTGWLIAAERTRAVLVIQLWMNGLNILLDLWFVLGMDWGVAGVAWATFIAEWSGVVLGLWFCRGAFARPAWRDWARVANPAALRIFARVNSDILLRSLMLQAIFLSFIFLGARFGDVQLAANHVLLLFLEVTAYAMDGFAFAAEALVGQALGARQRLTLRRAALLTSAWALGICVALAAVFAVFGGAIIDAMTTAPDVRQMARVYLPYMVLSPLLGTAAWMLDGVFIGATRTRDMRNMMAVSAVIYFAAAVPLMALFGNHGLWVALLLSFVARGVTLGLRYSALEAQAG